MTAPRYINRVIDQLRSGANQVLEYEDKALQEEALKLIPLERITLETEQHLSQVQELMKEKQIKEDRTDKSDFFVLYLMKWFRKDFFSWVDKLDCEKCLGETVSQGQRLHPISHERIEIFHCSACSHNTEFQRYNSVADLMKFRRGRCGEWANCFTFFCRALGYETRLIHDLTDHAWTEVYSPQQNRWIHCDSCEVMDQPLLYEKGWNKKLTYILAVASDHVQDVTWRYTADFKATRARRNLVSEEDLIHAILDINKTRQATLPPAHRKKLLERQVAELAQFLTEPTVSEGQEFGGRMSGSLAWRLARGEISEEKAEREAEPHTFQVKDEDFVDKTFTLEYCPVTDSYYTNRQNISATSSVLNQWRYGVFECENVFRKVETDWQMVYLCRKPKCTTGYIRWKLDFSSLSHPVDHVQLRVVNALFENGQVTWKLLSKSEKSHVVSSDKVYSSDKIKSGDNALSSDRVPGDKKKSDDTDAVGGVNECSLVLIASKTAIKGSSNDNIQELVLDSKLSSVSHLLIEASFDLGRDSYAWQHAQIFRTSTRNKNPQPPAPFMIIIRKQS